MSKKILIFGYSGFVGPYLAKEFEKDGYVVYGCDVANPTFGSAYNFAKCDILNYEEVDTLIKSILPDVIVNLAAISSVGQSWKIPQATISINIVGSLNILESIKQLETKPKVLFVGSSEEYEASDKPINEGYPLNSNNPYGISKYVQERFAESYRKEFGLKIYCVRSFNHIGVGQKGSFVIPSLCKQVATIEKSKKPGFISVGNISVYRDFSDVRDIVKAYKMILDSKNDEIIYNVGSGKAYKIEELLKFIISLSSQKIDVIVDKGKFRQEDTPFVCCDNTRLKKMLNWKPVYDIKETIKDIYLYFLREE